MSTSQDMGILVLTGLAFICMLYVVSPQLFLGLVGGIGAWQTWRTGEGTSGRKIRRMKVYIKRTHKGQCGEINQEAGLHRGAQLETRLYNMDKILYKFNDFLQKREQEQISRTTHTGTQHTRFNGVGTSVPRNNEYVNMQQNRPASEVFPV